MSSHKFDGFTSIDSDHLDGAKYDAMQRRMTVRFQNGYQYHVHGISPKDYEAFMDAPSQGEHYHTLKETHHIERVK